MVNNPASRLYGGKGIDVVGNLTVGGLTDVKTVIQVKRYKEGNDDPGSFPAIVVD